LAGSLFANLPKGTNIAVLDFTAVNVSAADAVAISDFVRTALVKTKIFNIVERNNIDKILAEQGFQQTGCTTEECAVRIGKVLNVQKAIIGSYSKVENMHFITADVIDIETEEITDSKRVQFNSLADISSAIDRLASFISGVEIKPPDHRSRFQYDKRNDNPRIITSRKLSPGRYEVEINRGILDKVEKKNVYDVVSPETMAIAGKLKLTQIFREESAGMAFSKKYDIYTGYYAIKSGKIKVGGIGMMGGIMRVPGGRSGDGISIYYDYIHSSGLGFQFNLGIWESDQKINFTDNNGNVINDREIYLYFDFPCILKYHTQIFSPTSSYVGVGVYDWNPFMEMHWRWNGTTFEILPEISEHKVKPVLNAGIDFFKTSPIHLTLDWKRFIGEKFYGINTTADALSLGLSINW